MAFVKVSKILADCYSKTLNDLADDKYHCPETLRMIADGIQQCETLSNIINESVEEQRQDST